MLTIKNKLKIMGITLAELANKLEISRPTLDTYIELYESKEKIPKEKYQILFDRLFSEKIQYKKEFFEELDKCHDLIERDKLLGTLNMTSQKTDIITSVVEEMKKDMNSENYDESMYIFINMFIRSYNKEKIFKKLARYFLLLNGKIGIDSITDEEHIYLANYFKVFFYDKNNLLKENDEFYRRFIKRCNEIKKNEREIKEKIECLLLEKVQDKIKDLLAIGIDINQIDIESLLTNIKFNKD